jgi:hypothetical protein
MTDSPHNDVTKPGDASLDPPKPTYLEAFKVVVSSSID